MSWPNFWWQLLLSDHYLRDFIMIKMFRKWILKNMFKYDIYKKSISTLLTVVITTICVLIIFLVISFSQSIPFSYFMKDPAAIMNVPFYIGILSNIGILFWCSTSVICFFSYAYSHKKIKKEISLFILISGLITLILLMDDLLLLHEGVFPYYFNIPEIVTYIIYGIIIFLYFFQFRKIILNSEYLILLFSLINFGMSILLDIMDIGYTIEDMFKIIGIVCWFTYFFRYCSRNISRI